MCGIAGYVRVEPDEFSESRLRSLLGPIRPRGPDDEGVWLGNRRTGDSRDIRTRRTAGEAAAGSPSLGDPGARFDHDVALLATRYAVMDRSVAGHQPFVGADGTVVGVLNGEIFNHPVLREEMEAAGLRFRSRSDVEVLVEGYRRWGHELWPRLNGFWAVALYDARRRRVVLSRDRLGIAPLYCRHVDERLLFASRISPLLTAGATRPAMDRDVVRGFVETGLKDFDERTCWRSVRSLEPGVVVELGPGQAGLDTGRRRRIWHFPENSLSTDDLSLEEAVDGFRERFFDAVRIRLRSDLDVAFELSGGLDSSATVAAALAQGGDPVTYTLKVPEADEEPIARSMLDRHALDYRVQDYDHAAFVEEADSFARIMEEPYQSPNVYAHFNLLRRMKEDGFGVVLTGSGGDEVLAGYEHDFWPAARQRLFETGHGMQARRCGLFFKFGSLARTRRTVRWLTRSWTGGPDDEPAAGSREGTDGPEALTPAERLRRGYGKLGFRGRRLYHFQRGHLPYYLLADDHFSMSIPVETRTPFLDHRVVEWGLRLPAGYLFRWGYTKYVLRKAMEPYLPREILWRREKLGFPVPLTRFLRDHEPALSDVFRHVRGEHLPWLPVDGSYRSVMEEDPQRLWRICSTGLWLRSLGAA